jgi:uncharacterized protein YecE (DUF72 family)
MTETNRQAGKFFAGTSGVVVPQANKQLYPVEFQDKSRLHYYSSLFNSIEINSSFYKLPMARTVRNWAENVPEDFRFTFKLWRDITHVKELAFRNEDVDHFIQTISEVGHKKGCLLVQFPPSLTIRSSAMLYRLLAAIEAADAERGWRIALEFRNDSWYADEITALINDFQASVVLHDKLPAANSLTESETPFIYLRFHGYNGDYKGSYEDDFLSEYAQYIKEWMRNGKQVFVYFNNTRGEAVYNLISLMNFVRQ